MFSVPWLSGGDVHEHDDRDDKNRADRPPVDALNERFSHVRLLFSYV